MATTHSTTATTIGNEATYVSYNQLADAAMFISCAMRLLETKDDAAACLLAKAQAEIIAAQDYLEALDPVELPICAEITEALNRIGRKS